MTAPKYLREATIAYRRTTTPTAYVRHGGDVAAVLRSVIPDGPQEHFVVLAVDNRNAVTASFTAGIGSVGNAPVDVAAVFRFALLAGCRAIVLGHNHPSGDPAPSVDDVRVTERIIEAGRILGINVLDHVILGEGREYSFVDHGTMPT